MVYGRTCCARWFFRQKDIRTFFFDIMVLLLLCKISTQKTGFNVSRVYSLQSTVNSRHLNLSIPYTLYSILYILYSILYILYSIPCTLYSVLCTLYSIPCTLYPILYTLYSIVLQRSLLSETWHWGFWG